MLAIGVTSASSTAYGALSGGVFLWNDQFNEAWKSSAASGYAVAGRYFVPLPYGITSINRPVSICSYEGRLYICGCYTYNLILDEHHRLWKQGIRGPEAAPGISGASGTGAIAYISWWDEFTAERSPLSEGTIISTDTPRTWTLPARPPDDIFVSDGTMTNNAGDGDIHADSPAAREFYLRSGDRIAFTDAAASISYNLVNETGLQAITVDDTGVTPATASKVAVLPYTRATHIELWLSVAGGLPRLVMRVPVGTTSVVESTATGDLGESFIGSFERFPRCSISTIYHDRQVLAGDPDNPDTVYLSDLFYPERYSGLSFRTRSGAPVTGLLGLRDYCLVFTRDQTYVLQGYTTSDFTLTMVEQSLGSIGHNCNAVVHGSAYVWTEKGPYMFNGAWHPLSPENDFTQPGVDSAGFARGVVDPDSNTYMLIPKAGTISLFDRYLRDYEIDGIHVFDYTMVQPEAGGGFAPARISLDTQDYNSFGGNGGDPEFLYHYLSNKWGLGRLYSLSYDSNAATDSFDVFKHLRMDDNLIREGTQVPVISFPYFKVLWGHHFFDAPGMTFVEGKTFRRFWLDARFYNENGGKLYLYPGDDDAFEMHYGDAFPTSVDKPSYQSAPVSFELKPHLLGYENPDYDEGVGTIAAFKSESLTGRGLTLLYECEDLGQGGTFRGFGLVVTPGTASRFGRGSEPQ